MEIRRLERREHGRTRKLYESVFPEDDRKFVDYYYTWKTRENTIYVAEDEDGIHAMVHLNPFQVSVCGRVQTVHYIVAVATQEEYRHRGLMRSLLNLAMREMTEAGEPFTFLMPADEAIYRPFGFRFVYAQRQGIWRAARGGDKKPCRGQEIPKEAECRPARREEYRQLAALANRILARQADIFVYREEDYYERLAAEQRSQDGEVMVILSDGRMIGTFCTSFWEGKGETAGRRCELREILADPEFYEEARCALQRFVDQNGDCKVEGCLDGFALEKETYVPLIMAKALAAESGDGTVFINEVV